MGYLLYFSSGRRSDDGVSPRCGVGALILLVSLPFNPGFRPFRDGVGLPALLIILLVGGFD